MDILDRIIEEREKIALAGLGLLMLLAGITKFTMTSIWTGFEPRIVTELLPLTSTQLTLLGGIFEVLLGLSLLARIKTFFAASATFLWLMAITIQVSTLGLWSIAIRDLGLTFYALTVALNQYG